MVEVEINELLFHMRNDVQLLSLKKLIRIVCTNTEDIIKYLIQNRDCKHLSACFLRNKKCCIYAVCGVLQMPILLKVKGGAYEPRNYLQLQGLSWK